METPFKVAELDHLVLCCRNQAQMLEFYTQILGLGVERRLDSIGLIQLRAGASMVDLVPALEARSEPGRNLDHFCLGIVAPDLFAAITYLREHGVEVIGPPQVRYGARGQGNSLYIRDPEGNTIELKQMADECVAR